MSVTERNLLAAGCNRLHIKRNNLISIERYLRRMACAKELCNSFGLEGEEVVSYAQSRLITAADLVSSAADNLKILENYNLRRLKWGKIPLCDDDRVS